MAQMLRVRQRNCWGSAGIEPATDQPAEADGDISQPQSQFTTSNQPRQHQQRPPTSTLDDTVDSGGTDDDIDNAPCKMASWQEYCGPYFTAKAGLGFLVEADAYAQDDASKEQFKMLPAQRLRDFRFVFGGGYPSLPRKVTCNVGVMYDAPTHSWLMRQTGIMGLRFPNYGAISLSAAPRKGSR